MGRFLSSVLSLGIFRGFFLVSRIFLETSPFFSLFLFNVDKFWAEEKLDSSNRRENFYRKCENDSQWSDADWITVTRKQIRRFKLSDVKDKQIRIFSHFAREKKHEKILSDKLFRATDVFLVRVENNRQKKCSLIPTDWRKTRIFLFLVELWNFFVFLLRNFRVFGLNRRRMPMEMNVRMFHRVAP